MMKIRKSELRKMIREALQTMKSGLTSHSPVQESSEPEDKKKKVEKCPTCNGRGKVQNQRDNPMKCPACKGRGFRDVKNVSEMKLGLSSGHGAARGEFTPDSLFDGKPFERDSESDMDDEFSLDHEEELVVGGKGIQAAKLPRRR